MTNNGNSTWLVFIMCTWLMMLMSCTGPNDRDTPSDQFADTRERNVAVERIVSLDYCADQFVLRFAPAENIVAVSPDARKYFSYMRDAHPDIPSVRSTAEDVLALSPTRVVRSYGGGSGARAFFGRAGVEVVQLGYPATLSEVRHNIQHIAAELGNAAEGARVVEDFDRRLGRLGASSDTPSTLYTTPGGVTTGPGSLVHELMVAAGLSNFEQRAGWRDLPLEQLVFEQPDRLANATFGDPATHVDPWTLSRHPRARRLVEETPGVEFEGAWTSCGGWFLVDAVEALATLSGRGEAP